MAFDVQYDRQQLLLLYNQSAVPAAAVAERVRALGLWTVCRLRCVNRRQRNATSPPGRLDLVHLRCYRGRRSGRPRQSRVHSDRHSTPKSSNLVFGCLNIRSLANKLDDVLDVRRDQRIDVLFLVETWHDTDSVCLHRLRADGFQVVDQPRPRLHDDTVATNHGGVATLAVPGIRLSRVEIGVRPSTFELLCVRITLGSTSCVAAVVYRPGSAVVSPVFFDDVSDVLDHLATYVEPIYLVGDVNIRLDRLTDANAIQFNDVLTAHGLANRMTSATHDKGGALDIVAARYGMTSFVDVVDADLSDHQLLRWTAPFARPRPIYSTMTSRPWSRLKIEDLRAALVASPLCCSELWLGLSVDGLAQLYDTELTAIIDRLVPVRTSRYRRRPSDPWFDDDCRVAKRCVRLFEREARRASRYASDTATSAAIMKWRERCRAYRGLLKQKREEFWKAKVTAERSAPRQLWRSIDVLLGRGSSPSSAAISADDAHRFFDDKVAGVRASTNDAPPPTFSTAPANSRLPAADH